VHIVEKLSTEIVENNHVSGRIVESVEKLSPLFVDNFMEAISQVQTVEKLSTEIVDKSMAIKICCMKTSYPQSLWITRWKNV